jgi:3-phosphoshikimate 1-carboxyvinyltransferase
LTSAISIQKKSEVNGTITNLPSSKSLSNRALILNALSGNQSLVSNLSSARDTQSMQRLIGSQDRVIDVLDAGTVMRFLTAYFSITDQNKIITGTERMKQRPIGLLVDALRSIGCQIQYLEKEGFPPIEIQSFKGQKSRSVSVPGNISSQYISALMMVAPKLPHGLSIQLLGNIGSRPYIEMTAELMRQFGIEVNWEGQTINIASSSFKKTSYRVEPDWSAASYWFAFVALAEKAEIILPDVSPVALQGDRTIVEIMDKLGVKSEFINGNLKLSKKESQSHIEWNFTDCPDLAQTILPVCAAKGIVGSFTGLESLRIKETDRISALQNELAKINARLVEENNNAWKILPGDFGSVSSLTIDTYHDHRMAMGLAPLATVMNIKINEPKVVDKSYPDFWNDLKNLGFEIQVI